MKITKKMIDRLVEYDEKRTDYCVNCRWFSLKEVYPREPKHSHGICHANEGGDLEYNRGVGVSYWCRHHSPIPETEE